MESVKSKANGSTFQEISKSNFKQIETQISNEGTYVIYEYDKIGQIPIFDKIRCEKLEITTQNVSSNSRQPIATINDRQNRS